MINLFHSITTTVATIISTLLLFLLLCLFYYYLDYYYYYFIIATATCISITTVSIECFAAVNIQIAMMSIRVSLCIV